MTHFRKGVRPVVLAAPSVRSWDNVSAVPPHIYCPWKGSVDSASLARTLAAAVNAYHVVLTVPDVTAKTGAGNVQRRSGLLLTGAASVPATRRR